MGKNEQSTRGETRRQVLDAALEIVAERGLQALTHRGVEARADVSHGVTTYYFKNRDALIESLYEHMCEAQTAWITDMYAAMALEARTDPDGFRPDAYTRKAVDLLLSERSLILARYEMYLHAARNPHLRDAARRARDRHAGIQIQMFRSMGARHPELAARRILSATEGLLLYQVAMPEADFATWAAPYLQMISDGLVEFDADAQGRHTAWTGEYARS